MDAGSSLTTIIAVAGCAAAASIVGGLIALWRESTTLFMSIALGFASGVLLAIDNLSEGLSIGELIRSESQRRDQKVALRILGWTSLIGAAVLLSAILGWFLLRDVGRTVLAFLLASGAGGMFYLTITELVPESEKRQYQESAALSTWLDSF